MNAEYTALQELKYKLYDKLKAVNSLAGVYGYYNKETQNAIDELTEKVLDYNIYSRLVYNGQGFYNRCELIDRNEKTLKIIFEYSYL